MKFPFFEEIGASFFVTLLAGFVELDLFEELVTEGIAQKTAIFLNFVTGIVRLVVLFVGNVGLKEGFGSDEAVGVIDDSFLDDGLGGMLLMGLDLR